jgi:hypothetical protein
MEDKKSDKKEELSPVEKQLEDSLKDLKKGKVTKQN